MAFSTWIRNGKRSIERRWALYQALRRKAVSRRLATRPRLEALEDRWLLSTYLVTNTGDSGTGSLRDAINQANLGNYTEIDFNIGTKGTSSGMQTISPASALPALTASGVFINGYSESQWQGVTSTSPLIELNGPGAGSGTVGLLLNGDHNTVSGLFITNFTEGIQGGGCTIGGTAAGAGNVLSGNGAGIETLGETLVLGNYIGTNAAGTAAVPNRYGIEDDGPGDTIGGIVMGARNVISGNTVDGELIDNSVEGTIKGDTIQGNYIGLNYNGSTAIANGNGVEIDGADVTIGGTAAGAGNVISGNSQNGVLMGSLGAGNNPSGVIVQGNLIGTDATGTKAIGNAVGIAVSYSNINQLQGETIGGSVAGAANVISGNSGDGVQIVNGASGALLLGNYIGTDVSGEAALGNGGNGVQIDSGASNTIGGSVASAGNLIADNRQGGVLVNAGTGDTIRLNSIFANGSTGTGPGITLSNNGNNNLAAPNLLTATLVGNTLTVTGTFTAATANVSYALDFYANSSTDPEGKVYLGSLTTTPTSTGTQSFTYTTTTTVMGTYPLPTATLTDGSGDTSAFSNDLTSAPSAPTVTSNPASQTVTAGQDATFAASADGNPGPTVQWQVSTDGGKTFTDISEATSTRLTLASVTTAMSGYEYQAVFTNSLGSATTSAATLTVNAVAPPVYVVTTTADSGAGSLRDAITQANNTTSGITEIDFNIGTKGTSSGMQTISPGSALPALTASGVFINGYSENQWQGVTSTSPLIELNGASFRTTSDGLDLTGTNNTVSGLFITSSFNGIEVGGANNVIGGTAAGAGNVISGNTNNDLLIDGSATGVLVEGNFIGTDVTGTKALANGSGIQDEGSNTTIGGTTSGARNIISGYSSGAGVIIDGAASRVAVQGNYIGTDVTGTGALANYYGIELAGYGNDTLGGSVAGARNVISGNSHAGVLLDASDLTVQGNYVGTDATGAKAIANSVGVEVDDPNNTIGGTATAARNIISGNSNSGVLIYTAVTGVSVQGNYIGTDVTGGTAVANGIGVWVQSAKNTIGGTTTGAGNVISGNSTDGVLLDSNASGGMVQGNYIGTNAAGVKAIANSVGVEVKGANNTIGGTTSGALNVISGNTADGVLIDSAASGVGVEGNYIGTDDTGTKNIGNQFGIFVEGPDTIIGGTVTGARNIISGSTKDGVDINTGVSGVQVQGNFIGTDVTGANTLANSIGVEVDGFNNNIGGSFAAAGNFIADNSQEGVLVNGGTGDTIRLNSIYANGSTGTGPGTTLSNGGNNNVAAPNLDSATLNGNTLTVMGSFNSPSANNTYVLEFFANPSNDAEGKIFLGSLTVTPTTTGTQTFTFSTTNTSQVETNPLITTTLTDNSGDTSAFSNGAAVVNAPPGAPTVTANPSNQTVTAGQSAAFTTSASGSPTPTVQWQVSTDGGNTFTNIPGATSTTLTLNNVTTAMSGYEYEAVFTNSAGSATTSAATLTVNATGSTPTITGDPSSQSVTAGQNAALTASASGSPPPTVQWQVSTDGGKTFTNISGATSTTLTLNNVTTAMSGYEYEAVFTNSAGSATTSAATLTVNAAAPIITSNPSNQTVTAGQSATFAASAGGSPTPAVQWQVSSDGGKTFTDISGAASTTLTLNNIAAAMSGYEYRAVFSNSAGTATTSAATLTVQYAPTVATNPSNLSVTAGQSATFTAAANGNPPPTVQWQVSSDGGKTFSNISGATSATLVLINTSTTMNGYEYHAIFTNSAGSITSTGAALTVQTAPSPSSTPSTSPAQAQPTTTSEAQALVALILDIDALLVQNDPSSLLLLNLLSETLLGRPLPVVAELFSAIDADFTALVNFLLAG